MQQALAPQEKPGRAVLHRERIAVIPVARLELAFVVDGPDVIRRGYRGRGSARVGAPRAPRRARNQSFPLQDGVGGRGMGQLPVGLLALQLDQELLRAPVRPVTTQLRSEEHTSELQSPVHLVCRLLLEKKKSSRS